MTAILAFSGASSGIVTTWTFHDVADYPYDANSITVLAGGTLG